MVSWETFGGLSGPTPSCTGTRIQEAYGHRFVTEAALEHPRALRVATRIAGQRTAVLHRARRAVLHGHMPSAPALVAALTARAPRALTHTETLVKCETNQMPHIAVHATSAIYRRSGGPGYRRCTGDKPAIPTSRPDVTT